MLQSYSLYFSKNLAVTRIATLDAFRGLAALSVMIYHYTKVYRKFYGNVFDDSFDFAYGYMGVFFFFIISGFVIFLTLKHTTFTAGFLYKRFSRLYPIFWFCLFTTFLVVYLCGLPGRERSAYHLPANLTMIPTVFGKSTIDGAYWSLVPEFFFYIAMAIIFSFKRQGLFFVWGITVLLLNWVHTFLFEFPPFVASITLTDWGSFFFAGILFFKLLVKEYQNRWHIHLLLVLCMATSVNNFEILSAKIICGGLYVVFYLFILGRLSWLSWKPLLFLGKISFPLYLLHQNIGYVIMNYTRPYLSDYPIIFLLLPISVIMLAAWLAHKYIELPSMTWLRSLNHKWVNSRN